MITYKQLSLKDIFVDCQNKFDNDKYEFLEFLENTINLDEIVPASFVSHFYAATSNPRKHHLYPMPKALLLQLIFSIPTTSLLIVFLSFPPLFSDEDRLSQIINILLDNAISYSPEQSSILLDASIKKNNLDISVIDHGIGISAEDKKHIFDRFYRCDKPRTQKGHYGLGLSVANELVSLLDGKIYLSDTPGGGCTFTITIPWNIAE